MKFFALLTLALSSTALGSPYAPFTGKFKVDRANCNYVGLEDMERAYVFVTKDYSGASVLEMEAYGSDAGGASVLLGKGSRQAPGTDPKFHGKVTESWESSLVGNVILSNTKVTRPSINLIYFTKTIVRANPKSVTIQTTVIDGSGDQEPQTEKCRLLR